METGYIVANGLNATVAVAADGVDASVFQILGGHDFAKSAQVGDRLMLSMGTAAVACHVKEVAGPLQLVVGEQVQPGAVNSWLLVRNSPAVLDAPSPRLPDAGLESFAPANPTDGRRLYTPQSKWPKECISMQRTEGIYLGALWALGLGGVFALILLTDVVGTPTAATSMGLAFAAGLLGGTTFDVKWWYHTIAKGLWHLDRRAWRVTVPWVSAILSMFVHVLFKSDLIGILNPAALDKVHNILAFGFLVGYFSDSAIAKMAEIAESLFGAARGGRGTGKNE